MTQNEMLTYGTVAFAAFTLFYVFKKTPTKAVATQPGQQQRDAHMMAFMSEWDKQTAGLTLQANAPQYNAFTKQFGF